MKYIYEGLEIIKKYMTEDDFLHSSFTAEHDQVWCWAYNTDVMSDEDLKRMQELYWFEDMGAWSCFT